MHAACLWCNTTFEIPLVYSAESEGCIASAHARRSRSARRRFLRSLGVTIIRAPREDQWAPAYYSLLFEDPEE